MKKIYKKYGFNEVVFNNSKLNRLYQFYIHQTFFDKILDYLVFFAILFTISELVVQLFFNLNENIVHYLHIFSIFVLIIFVLELLREYAISNSAREFFKKHWLDFILVAFLSFYFLFATYLGFAKFKYLTNTNKFLSKIKHYKIAIKTVFMRN